MEKETYREDVNGEPCNRHTVTFPYYGEVEGILTQLESLGIPQATIDGRTYELNV